MENNSIYNILFLKMIIAMENNKYDYCTLNNKYAFDEQVQNVIWKIYMLLLRSEELEESQIDLEMNNIFINDFCKLTQEQKEYVREDINDLFRKQNENNLKRERND